MRNCAKHLCALGSPRHLEFYRAITERAIPVDLCALNVLKGSALALDIYSWLVHRLSYLKRPTTIPWELSQVQFGGEYANNKSGRYNFKMDFRRQLEAVLQIYSEAKVAADQQQGLIFAPSRLAIGRRRE